MRDKLLKLVKDIYMEGYHCGIHDEATYESYVDDILSTIKGEVLNIIKDEVSHEKEKEVESKAKHTESGASS